MPYFENYDYIAETWRRVLRQVEILVVDSTGHCRRIPARLTLTLYLVYGVLALKGARKFLLWTLQQNFKIMIIFGEHSDRWKFSL